jgi:hypothetical protein
MADTPARSDRTASRMAHWTPFRDLFGFDPFAPMRSKRCSPSTQRPTGVRSRGRSPFWTTWNIAVK